MGKLPGAPGNQAATKAALITLCAGSLLLSSQFRTDDAAWLYWLTMNEVSKAALCGIIAWSLPGKVRFYAMGAAVWYLCMGIIEYRSHIGCTDGFSAHGPWEWGLFAGLFGTIYLVARRHD